MSVPPTHFFHSFGLNVSASLVDLVNDTFNSPFIQFKSVHWPGDACKLFGIDNEYTFCRGSGD
ncbi:hypothetical protein, partial [Desulfosarcina sp.]|uniref:hypothetical protein n=1 Tax=Desulfosarcina sp. TaxID=2027861 RepID=UPI003970CE87